MCSLLELSVGTHRECQEKLLEEEAGSVGVC